MPPIRGISVVIPAYNAADTIVESVASVLATAEVVPECDFEVVIVDDGSTDGTRELVATEFAGESRVHLHRHRVNRGGAATRNTAVERANNDWLFCLDSDNLVDAESMRRVLAMAATGAWDVVAPAETRFFRDSPAHPIHSWFWDRDHVAADDVLRVYETPVACGNYLFTLEAWTRAGGYPEFAGSLDAWGFGVRLLFEGARFGVCPDALYFHRQGHESYYMRDKDDHRAIAAGQILLPYVHRLSASDRRRLLGDGDLLQFFTDLPRRPLELEGAGEHSSAGRIVVAQPAAMPRTGTSRSARARAAVHRAWSELPPRSTMRRLLSPFRRHAPDSNR